MGIYSRGQVGDDCGVCCLLHDFDLFLGTSQGNDSNEEGWGMLANGKEE
jgi:hypothetical protein